MDYSIIVIIMEWNSFSSWYETCNEVVRDLESLQ